MRRGRRLPELKLSEEQRSTLQGWTRRRKTAQALSMRARIVLRASDGLTATAIAAEVHACIQTVSKWWRRFDEQGSDGLLDEPRPGQPRKLSDAQIEQVIVRTWCKEPPSSASSRSSASAPPRLPSHQPPACWPRCSSRRAHRGAGLFNPLLAWSSCSERSWKRFSCSGVRELIFFNSVHCSPSETSSALDLW